MGIVSALQHSDGAVPCRAADVEDYVAVLGDQSRKAL